MKLLIYEWESYLQYDLMDICKDLKIEYTTFRWTFEDKNYSEKFEKWFRENISLKSYDAMLSINYYPLLSEACQREGVPYIAWCYDNPLNVVNIEQTLGNDVNYVVFFDRVQASYYQNKGFGTAYYMPLGVNSKRLSNILISSNERKQYSCDVSLVGSLYESRMQDIINVIDDYSAGFVNALMNVQQNIYGCYMFDDLITEGFVRKINQNIKMEHPDTEFVLLKEALTFAMASEITRKERLILLTMLGRRYDTRLYSFQSSELLDGVKVFPPIDYVMQMPRVFACSKINLNPSLRCIQSGIPLRALDVMAAGGFLLSNYQPELAEYFEVGREVVLYDSIENAVELADYYLKNNEARKMIVQSSRQKVLQQFSLEDRLKTILKEVLG